METLACWSCKSLLPSCNLFCFTMLGDMIPYCLCRYIILLQIVYYKIILTNYSQHWMRVRQKLLHFSLGTHPPNISHMVYSADCFHRLYIRINQQRETNDARECRENRYMRNVPRIKRSKDLPNLKFHLYIRALWTFSISEVSALAKSNLRN